MLRPWSILVLAFLFACGDEEASPRPTDDVEPGPSAGPAEKVRIGPLANAGPDQRALPGMVVRLDARGTIPPEDGRPFRHRWLQEAGPRVHLSDPTAPVVEFVAPPIRPGDADRLVFRLTVDDGNFRSTDRVAVELVEDAAELASAPAAVGGADIEVRPGEEVEIPPPAFADPACALAEDPEACLAEPLPFCWTQVTGPRVEIEGACGETPTRFLAPAREGVLVFRLDAHARGLHEPAACGPEALVPIESPLCGAPDYLRVVVRTTPRRSGSLPTAWLRVLAEERPRVALIPLGGTAASIPTEVDVVAGGSDPERWRLFPRFRPVIGRLVANQDANSLRLGAPSWPGPVGVAYDPWFYHHLAQGGQVRLEWLRAAPSLAVLHWLPPSDTPPLQAELGDRPCGAASPEGSCEPLTPGEEVVLVGRMEGGGVQGCWDQTHGPRVDLVPSSRCTADNAERRFVAPAPAGGAPLELAFQFTVRDAGPYESRPATLWLQVRPEDVFPPQVVLDPAPRLAPGTSTELDASGSVDPHGGMLAFRWRQVAGPPLGVRGCDDLPEEACVVVTAPLDAVGRAEFELEVASQATRLITRRRFAIEIAEETP